MNFPYRFKVTKGLMNDLNTSGGDSWPQTYLGEASSRESVSSNLYWGVMSNKVSNINNPNSKGDGSFSALQRKKS